MVRSISVRWKFVNKFFYIPLKSFDVMHDHIMSLLDLAVEALVIEVQDTFDVSENHIRSFHKDIVGIGHIGCYLEMFFAEVSGLICCLHCLISFRAPYAI